MIKNPVIGPRIILLKDERYIVLKIRKMATNHHHMMLA
jgi:hypothetical protein